MKILNGLLLIYCLFYMQAHADYIDAGLAGKEDITNKSTDVLLGSGSPSDILYCSQKAVKTYIDTKQPALGYTAENVANKSNGSLSTSTTNYPTSSAVKIYVDSAVANKNNYVSNPDAVINTAGWNVYSAAGNTVPASVVDQDITYTSTTSGDAGNGATVTYSLGTSPYAEPPVITCPTGSSVLVKWYNGPTLANNPTATVLKAAWDASCALSMATAAITGNASTHQYQTGTVALGNGGDTSPVDGTGGSPTGVTITRNTSTPLGGVADLDLGKDAASREGMGVSTDFTIEALDKGAPLEISFAYEGSAAMVLGTSSDVRVFLYDVTNAAFIPVTPLKTLAGPISTIKTFVGQFTASNSSVSYRLIFHVATTNASAWDLRLHEVTVDDAISATTATQVPSVVLNLQPINGSVTDHMAVMWTDGAAAWVPATVSGAANSVFGDDVTMLGFATNIVGLTASIYVGGFMDGFSFGPFVGYEWMFDPSTSGGITPLPSPFTDTWISVGKPVTSTGININFNIHKSLLGSLKGALLTNTGANDGTGDVSLANGTTGQFLMANPTLTKGLIWTTFIATAPITYTAATHTFACTVATTSVPGCISAASMTAFSASAPLASPAFTGTPSLPTGTTGITQTAADSTTKIATTAFVTTADNLKANLASPTFTGTPTLPTGTIATTQAANDSTTKIATTAFVTTADNLKAPLSTPVFTNDVTSSTGNVVISTIGKGLQVKTGTNAKIGQATLVGGTKTVANTSVTANSKIFLSDSTPGGTLGNLSYTKSVGTSFTITSSNVLDTSTIDWYIVESIP